MNLSEVLSTPEDQQREVSRTADRRTPSNALCLVCGSSVQLVLDKVTDTRFGISGFYDICRCSACGFEQTSPIPTLERLKSLYEAHYNFGGETGTVYTRLRERFFASFFYRIWTFLDGDISFHLRRGNGRLLDVGCNEGRGLSIYARNGFQAEGLELNENAAEVARRRGFVVHTCLLGELNTLQKYSVAVLSNVLEHSLHPKGMLDEVSRVLEPVGQVWISCPNSKSWLRKIFGRFWINWHVPFHISHFSGESLRTLLVNAGYRDITIRQITPGLWVASSLVAYLFAKPNKKTEQLRDPFLVPLLVLASRFVLFPCLWLGNVLGRGDCLLAVATKGAD